MSSLARFLPLRTAVFGPFAGLAAFGPDDEVTRNLSADLSRLSQALRRATLHLALALGAILASPIMSEAATITVTVTGEDGKPLSGREVWAYNYEESIYTTQTTDAQGRAVFRYMPAGHTEISAQPYGSATGDFIVVRREGDVSHKFDLGKRPPPMPDGPKAYIDTLRKRAEADLERGDQEAFQETVQEIERFQKSEADAERAIIAATQVVWIQVPGGLPEPYRENLEKGLEQAKSAEEKARIVEQMINEMKKAVSESAKVGLPVNPQVRDAIPGLEHLLQRYTQTAIHKQNQESAQRALDALKDASGNAPGTQQQGSFFRPGGSGTRPVIFQPGPPALPGAPASGEGQNVGFFPPNIDFEFAANGTVGHASGASHRFLALEVGGQLTLGAVEFEPEGTETGFEMNGRIGILDNQSPTPRDRIFFGFNFFDSSYSDSQSLGSLDPGAAGLGIPGTGDPGAAFPAGVFLLPPNAVTNLAASFDSEATGATVSVGTEFVLSPNLSVSPSIGLQWTRINQSIGFSGDILARPIAFDYDTRVESDRASVILSTEISYAPNYRLGQFEIEYYAVPALYLDRLDFSGTDRLMLTGVVSDNQQVGFGGADGGIGGGIRLGVEIEPEHAPVKFYVGVTADRRLSDVTVFRSGQTGEQSTGEVGYQGEFAVTFGLKMGF